MTAATGDEPTVWWLAADDADGLLARLDALDGSGSGGGVHIEGGGTARLGIVEPNERKVRLARRMLTEGKAWRGRSDLWFTPTGLVDEGGKVAFLFPGVEPTFGADDTDLSALADRLHLEAPPLSDDTIAHRSASIVRLGIFLDQALRRLGVAPDVVAGHSIGEWSGSVAAGVFTRDQADRLLDGIDLGSVDLPDLDFVALSAGAADVEAVVGDMPGVVVSHDNCPGQAVICGPPEYAGRALAALRDAGILGYTLDFQSGFHTPFIEPSLVEFRAYLEGMDVRPARIPLWSATTTELYPTEPAEIVDLHLRHLVEPVRFRPMVEKLYHEAGVRIFLQAGIGTLTGFVEDTLGDLPHATVQALTPKRSALGQAYRTLTALWVEGLPVTATALTDAAGTPAPPEATTAETPEATWSPGTETAGTAEEPQDPEALEPAEIPPFPDPPLPDAPGTSPEPVPAPAAAAVMGTVAVAERAREAVVRAVAGDAGGSAYPLLAAAELLTAAARASQDVLEALSARLAPAGAPSAVPALAAVASAPAPALAPAAVTPEAAGGQDRLSAGDTGAPPADSGPPGGGGSAWPTGKVVVTRRLSLETMPETIDHSLYHQPPGWPDVTDGFPIVAMTTQIQLLQDVAAEYAGDRDVVEVFGVRNLRWLDLSAPQDVDITIVPKADDVLAIALGGYCRANIRVGRFDTAPRHERRPLANPQPTAITAQEMFDKKVMFHGPKFQGIDALGPTGDDGILGEFDNLDTPGSLLDNLGKIIAYWVIEQRNPGESPLPIGVDRIRFFGPPPEPGVDIHCDVRILELQPHMVRADGVLVLPNGDVWCHVEGWTSNVFHIDQVMEPIYHRTGENFATEPQPGGWNVVIERWPTGAGRDLTARRFLSRAERQHYETMNLLEQRRWLIDVIAAKDSIRRWLHEQHGVEAFPVEVHLEREGEHRFRASSPLIPEGHDLHVTVSELHWLAVAILGDGSYRDIEAREVPDGADPAEVEREAVEAVRTRNPGAEVTSVDRADAVTPSNIDVVVIPRIAVAWTV